MSREFLLAGRPNSGKTSLFNRLAGAEERVGNYAGCTVAKKTAQVEWFGQSILLTDLPGIISIKPNSIDEKVALRELDKAPASAEVVTVIDGNNLLQELEFPLLLRERGHSVVIAVNMMDEVRANRKILNLAGMRELAGIPFFGISAKTGEGVDALKKFLAEKEPVKAAARKSVQNLDSALVAKILDRVEPEASRIVAPHQKVSGENLLEKRTDRIDFWLTHKFFGPLVFLLTMFVLFQSVFTWAGPLTDLIDSGVTFVSDLVRSGVSNELLASLLADGVLAGVGAVIVFVPQIAILFTLISILELSGYLPRAAYMIDRIMKPYGLDGKVFVPLLSSMACAVPGIMAARSVENPRSRLVTIMISPLMTCSARLPVYTLLIAAFVPATSVWGLSLQGLVMAAMYALGIIMALAVALVLRFSMSNVEGRQIDFIHLPRYRWPSFKNVWYYVKVRVTSFLKKAGTIIALMSILLWAILSFPRDNAYIANHHALKAQIEANAGMAEGIKLAAIAEIDHKLTQHQLEYSLGGRLGKLVEPIFEPLGYDWKLSIGLIASLAAREVFVSTIGTVFALGSVDENSESLVSALRSEKRPDGTPAYTIATCLSLLVFFAFSLQCISTIGVARREANSWKIPIVMFIYMFAIAYGGAFLAYRLSQVIFI
jgi:ferrous iron transport protein B